MSEVIAAAVIESRGHYLEGVVVKDEWRVAFGLVEQTQAVISIVILLKHEAPGLAHPIQSLPKRDFIEMKTVDELIRLAALIFQASEPITRLLAQLFDRFPNGSVCQIQCNSFGGQRERPLQRRDQ